MALASKLLETGGSEILVNTKNHIMECWNRRVSVVCHVRLVQMACASFLLLGFMSMYFPPFAAAIGYKVELPTVGCRHINGLTVVGWILPHDVLVTMFNLHVPQFLFLFCGMLWLFGVAVRISALGAALGFLITWSAIVEHQHYTRHETHALSVGLIVFALYAQFRPLATTFNGRAVGAAMVPAWPFEVLAFWLGFTYTTSGIHKIYRSGLEWIVGAPIQLWLLGVDAVVAEIIRTNYWVAVSCQISALLLESLSLACVVWRFGLIPLGFGLFAMHAINIYLFGFYFLANMLMIAWVFILYQRFCYQKA